MRVLPRVAGSGNSGGLMFLCPKCHDESKHEPDVGRSYGRCEQCGRQRVCIDCKRSPCTNPEIVALREQQRKERTR